MESLQRAVHDARSLVAQAPGGLSPEATRKLLSMLSDGLAGANGPGATAGPAAAGGAGAAADPAAQESLHVGADGPDVAPGSPPETSSRNGGPPMPGIHGSDLTGHSDSDTGPEENADDPRPLETKRRRSSTSTAGTKPPGDLPPLGAWGTRTRGANGVKASATS